MVILVGNIGHVGHTPVILVKITVISVPNNSLFGKYRSFWASIKGSPVCYIQYATLKNIHLVVQNTDEHTVCNIQDYP